MRIRLLALLIFCAWMASNAAAQYPSKPIRIVVPFTAGGATDTVVRIIASPLSQALGQPILVENKPGADGAIAAEFVAKSAPDGYTILAGGSTAMLGVPALRKIPPYDVVKDFAPITTVGRITFFLVVHPSVPATTLAELIDHARANPGKLNYAANNLNEVLAFAQLKSLSSVDMVQVPYKGSAIPDLLSARIHLSFDTAVEAVPLITAGRLRPLATLLPERSSLLPSVPTVAEAGIPRLTVIPWTALFTPSNTPKDIVERLSREVNVILRRPEIRVQMEKQGVEPAGSTPGELGALLKQQLVEWRGAALAAGLKPE